MGNLARPGYTASTDGMWPYRYVSFFPFFVKTNATCILFTVPSSNAVSPFNFSYDSCDVGTFPNQTDADGAGPPAALSSNASSEMYNFSLSWLPGQRAS